MKPSTNDFLSPLKTLDNLFFKKEIDSSGNSSGSSGASRSNDLDFGNNSSEQSENIKVAIRVRPLTREEKECEEAVSVLDESTVIIKKGLSRAQMFFDRVFPPETGQAEVYDMVKDIIHAVTEGYNGTVFAYGQTGTGKTHTMLGFDLKNNEQKGIIPRSVNHILDHISRTSHHTKYKMYCSYLEIYNEKIYDLLAVNNSNSNNGNNGSSNAQNTNPSQKSNNSNNNNNSTKSQQILEIRENRSRGVYVQDLTFSEVSRRDDIFALMERGAINRSIAATNMNERSSRSHTVFSLHIEQQDKRKKSPDNPVKISKLNLVDLAGSEKWDTFGGRISEKRIQELTNINQSLSTLGNCISALMQPGRSHIPFRDSKLTRLLQDSLGGNTKTVFIATISPSVLAYEETHSTLKFADRAKRVVVTTRVNEVVDDSILVKRYEKEIQRLRHLLKEKHGDFDELRRLKEENSLLKKENAALHNLLKKQGVTTDGLFDETVNVKSAELGRKLEMLRDIESDQKDREAELNEYHTWLHSIPVKYEGEEYSLDLRERLTLMEKSVKMQSGELIRAKKLFMRDLNIVKQELTEKNKEVEKLQAELEKLTAKKSATPEVPQPTKQEVNKENKILVDDIEHRGRDLRKGMQDGISTFQTNLKGMIHEIVPDSASDDINSIIEGCSEALEETILQSILGFVSLTLTSVKHLSSHQPSHNPSTKHRSHYHQHPESKKPSSLNCKSVSQQTDIVDEENQVVETIKECLRRSTQTMQETTRNEQYWIEMIDRAHIARSFQSRVYMYSGVMKRSLSRLLNIVRKFQQCDTEKLEYYRRFLEETLREFNLELQGYESHVGYHNSILAELQGNEYHLSSRKRSKSVPSPGQQNRNGGGRRSSRDLSSDLNDSIASTDSWTSYDLGLEDLVL